MLGTNTEKILSEESEAMVKGLLGLGERQLELEQLELRGEWN